MGDGALLPGESSAHDRERGVTDSAALPNESAALAREHRTVDGAAPSHESTAHGRAHGAGDGAALNSESSALLSERPDPGAAHTPESGALPPEHPHPEAAHTPESTALHAERWSAALAPVAETVADLILEWLPKATYPVRHGTHANSAFSLGLILDSAERAGQERLLGPVRAKVREWYVPDHGAATRWEPSGQDFLSPALAEADVVRRVLPEGEFAEWLGTFLPELAEFSGPEAEDRGAGTGMGTAPDARGRRGHGTREGDGAAAGTGTFMAPPRISDPADPQIGHLFGLCLSRAAALRNLADALPAGDPRVLTLMRSAEANLDAALPATTSGDFTTDHWLATFAALALDGGV
ncbi:DUF2891 family protein [Streptomyces iconiensis]|uniref:DUF2891 family protein n=1 Tax=Streptomyces iconiensis TaxID=1384038 RepID=A0ABT7AAU6_9ACTN|nr:DUF2891 family protein [Streptomyces iconiensis]MDJ1138449.1 DUF2891 family protein [Streptomyces iconiensis]